ncbi:sulfotransferase domain-containing protein [Guptibacillus hwajinpoensis]|uniref:sulfotransferase domain-containing protein n=1 Tax=Guptibacillus hwajinpoensis TaxID=208199 RepID=UPI0037361301
MTSSDLIKPFFVNSIAKSGTHLLRPLLEGVPNLKHDAFIYPGHLHQLDEHRKILSKLKPNHFANGHLFHSQEYVQMIKQLHLKQLFLYRDPRDIVVSYAYFFMRFPDHPYRRFFTENNMSVKERCSYFINGNLTGGLVRPNINNWYRKFLGWKNEDGVLPISYESLVHSDFSQKEQLARILHYLNVDKQSLEIDKVIEQMQRNADPSKSLTYRKGTSGDWQKEFDADLKSDFKTVAGDLLIELGYEKNKNW